MSVKRQLPPVPKTGDIQTKAWMNAVTEILRDLQKQTTLQSQSITQATATVDVSGLGISKASIGLGNVDNTSDKNKPISDQTQTALGNKMDKATFTRYLEEVNAVGEWDVATETDEDIGAEPGQIFKVTVAGTYASKDLFVDDYVQFYDNAGSLDVIIFVDPDRKADKTTNMTAGDGLTGGGTLAGDRNFVLGTPGSISSSTSNSVSTDSHTHELATSGVTPGTYTKLTVDSKGIVTAGTTLSAADIPDLDWSKITSGKPTTLSGYGITDGVNVSEVVTVAAPGKILKLDVNSKLPADITGNAATATKLANARSIALSGDATGSASFDGSADISISATLANTGVSAGNYTKLTVNTKGLVTAGGSLADTDIPALDWSKISTGKPTSLSGYGITDGQPLDDTLTGISALAMTAGQVAYATGADVFSTFSTTANSRALLATTDLYGLGTITAAIATDLDTLTGKGQWFRWGSSTTNAPTSVGLGNSGVGIHLPRASNGSNDVQLAFDTAGKAAIRACTSGTWGAWFPIYTSNNATPYNTTTATAANMVVTSTGAFQRSTSSMQYKTDVEPMLSSIANALVDQAEPIFYRSLCSVDPQDWSWYGLSAEQIAAIDPRFVAWKTHEWRTVGEGDNQRQELFQLETPSIEGVFYERLVVPLLLVVKQLKNRISALEDSNV